VVTNEIGELVFPLFSHFNLSFDIIFENTENFKQNSWYLLK
jgi:hypothetical protein